MRPATTRSRYPTDHSDGAHRTRRIAGAMRTRTSPSSAASAPMQCASQSRRNTPATAVNALTNNTAPRTSMRGEKTALDHTTLQQFPCISLHLCTQTRITRHCTSTSPPCEHTATSVASHAAQRPDVAHRARRIRPGSDPLPNNVSDVTSAVLKAGCIAAIDVVDGRSSTLSSVAIVAVVIARDDHRNSGCRSAE